MQFKKSVGRVWEIDFLRGLSIVLMVFDHLFFDLMYMYGVQIPLITGSLQGLYDFLQFFFAGCFIFLSGVSSSFSRSNLKRGAKLLAIAAGLTLVTFIVVALGIEDKQLIIFFGILHLLAVCMLLSAVLIKLKSYLLVLIGGLIISLSPLVDRLNEFYRLTDAKSPIINAFSPIGIFNNYFFSGDYFGLIAQLGVFILGLAFGKIFYKERKSFINLKPNFFNIVGRYSIWVYLIHQPLILGVLYLVFGH